MGKDKYSYESLKRDFLRMSSGKQRESKKKRTFRQKAASRISKMGHAAAGEIRFHAQVTGTERRAYREEKMRQAVSRGKRRAQKWGTRKSKGEQLAGMLSGFGKAYAKSSRGSDLFGPPSWVGDRVTRKKPKKKRYMLVRV